MTSSNRERQYRLDAIRRHVERLGSADRQHIQSIILQVFGVSGETAREYIRDLVAAGLVEERFGHLHAKPRGEGP